MVLISPILKFARLRDAVLIGILALAACSSSGVKPNPTDPSYSGRGGPGDPYATRLGGEDSGLIFGTAKTRERDQGGGAGGGALGVNAYLWRGALDTFSFMPLTSADPFGGVIITDWYTTPAAPGERFKVTAYILGRDLRSDGVRVSVFTQVLQGGQWVDVPVPASTASELENKVLDRARRLREQQARG